MPLLKLMNHMVMLLQEQIDSVLNHQKKILFLDHQLEQSMELVQKVFEYTLKLHQEIQQGSVDSPGCGYLLKLVLKVQRI